MFDRNKALDTVRGNPAFYDVVNPIGHYGYWYYDTGKGKEKPYSTLKCHRQQVHKCPARIIVSRDTGEVLERRHQDGHSELCIMTEIAYINLQAVQQTKAAAKRHGTSLSPKMLYKMMHTLLQDASVTSEHYVSNEGYKLFNVFESLRCSISARRSAGEEECVDVSDSVRAEPKSNTKACPTNALEIIAHLNDPNRKNSLLINIKPDEPKEEFIFARDVVPGLEGRDNDVCICFGTVSMFKELCAQELVAIDGTFKVVPRELYKNSLKQ